MDTEIRTHISALIDELPPESLKLVEQFIRFLRQQAQMGQPVGAMAVKEAQKPYLYPTVRVPTESLTELIGIMPSVGGDALEDSEALYDLD